MATVPEEFTAPLTLTFEGEEKGELVQLNAAQLADSLQGLVEFASLSAKHGVLGEGPPPEVMIEPPERGSFTITAILLWATANPEAAYTMGTGLVGGFIWTINMATKSLRARPSNFEYLENGHVKITWQDKTVDEVPIEIWETLQKEKRRSKKALRKLYSPMSGNATTVAIDNHSAGIPLEHAVSIAADRNDYLAAAAADEEEEPGVEIFEVEGRLQRIDFAVGKPWTITTDRGTRHATVEDQDFLDMVNEGLALKKTDIFRFRIREESMTANGRRRLDWFIERVLSHRQGA